MADASVVVDLLLGRRRQDDDALWSHLETGSVVAAPYLIDAEVGQVIRRFSLAGAITSEQAETMLQDFADLPIKRYPHLRLVFRAFEFRENVTFYDGLYLALAEALECPFLTGDSALFEVPGCRADVEIVPTSV